ncbi:39S ribosomal protein L32, mitochondrial [Pseudolycoriella hygida]|uniref:Large ribosomal subunit protein bL32m n=1 Tax=Pseudolycoriella hygida TaxID=35572 RepID=A0A9Q0MQ81_9DIPT|nr:39S ribosomal protein L32, mitochondrial [Pseudolycoriella hygida]
MIPRILVRLEVLLQHMEHSFPVLFGTKPPPSIVSLVASNSSVPISSNSVEPFSLKDLIGDGFLWAVPRNRRTIEKRLKRKFGHPDYVWKLIKPKTTLRTCNQCGHDYEVGLLCPHCYDKVRKETELIQEKIQKELGLDPVDKEVIVLYDGEKGEKPNEQWNGKRIVEMQRPRPMWFSKNLMQKTTQPAATTEEAKPNELG